MWCLWGRSQGAAADQQASSESTISTQSDISNYTERERENIHGAEAHREYILGYLYD